MHFTPCYSVSVLDFEQVTPATFNLLLFSSGFRVSVLMKFVNVILSFGCMTLLLWKHIFKICLNLFNCLIFINITVVNFNTFVVCSDVLINYYPM